MTITPGDGSLAVAWSDPVAKRFQLRYRPAGSHRLGVVPVGGVQRTHDHRTRQRPAYEVEVRKYVHPKWQPWSTFTATPNGGIRRTRHHAPAAAADRVRRRCPPPTRRRRSP